MSPHGKIRWKVSTGDKVTACPAIGVDGTIYVGSWDNHLYAVTPQGAVKWKVDLQGNVESPALDTDGTVYAVAANTLCAITSEGDVKWRFKLRGTGDPPLVDADGIVYVASQDNWLYAVTRGGELKWEMDLGSDLGGRPAIGVDGSLYIGSSAMKAYLYAVGDPAGGK